MNIITKIFRITFGFVSAILNRFDLFRLLKNKFCMKEPIGKWSVMSFGITKDVRLCLRSLVMMWSMIVEKDKVTMVGTVIIGKAPLLNTMFTYPIAVLVWLLLSILMFPKALQILSPEEMSAIHKAKSNRNLSIFVRSRWRYITATIYLFFWSITNLCCWHNQKSA